MSVIMIETFIALLCRRLPFEAINLFSASVTHQVLVRCSHFTLGVIVLSGYIIISVSKIARVRLWQILLLFSLGSCILLGYHALSSLGFFFLPGCGSFTFKLHVSWVAVNGDWEA